MFTALLVSSLVASGAFAQTYSATYLPSNAPAQSEQGQAGTNECGTGSNQTSECQNAYINSVTDFCLFAPPEPGASSTIGDTERFEVSWCMKDGYGTRLIPDGSITGAHFVQTPDFVQITGVGDLTHLNIPAGDEGGELDPHGADGNGNPIGGLVFSSAFGSLAQMHEWTNFMSDSEFCFRACKDGPKAPGLCMHIYDVMGCEWNMPANYAAGVFENCLGDSGEPMGVYGTSTFFQGEPNTPAAHPAPSSSECTSLATISNNAGTSTASATTTTSTSSVGTSSTSSSRSSSGVATSTATSSSSSGTGGTSSGSGSAGTAKSSSGTGSSKTSSGSTSTPTNTTDSTHSGARGSRDFASTLPIAAVVMAVSALFGGILIL